MATAVDRNSASSFSSTLPSKEACKKALKVAGVALGAIAFLGLAVFGNGQMIAPDHFGGYVPMLSQVSVLVGGVADIAVALGVLGGVAVGVHSVANAYFGKRDVDALSDTSSDSGLPYNTDGLRDDRSSTASND